MKEKRNRRLLKKTLALMLRFSPIIGVFAGILVGGIFVMIWGQDPIMYITEMFKGAFGSLNRIGATLNRSAPLMLGGLGTAIAWRTGAINVGQEGQLFMGGLGAAVFAFWFGGLPLALGLPLTLLGGVLFGMLLVSIAIFYRLYNGVHEILTTLLLNFVGVLFVSFMISSVINDTVTSGTPQTPVFPESTWMPLWKELGGLHGGIFLALILSVLGGYMLWHTPLGFKMRMAGYSAKATRAAGYNPNRMFVIAMLISGGLSGLAGAVEVTGSIYNRLIYAFGTNLGFDSLVVALLADTNPFFVIPAALFFGALRVGALSMQRATGVPAVLLQIIQGSIMLFIVIGFAVGKNKKLQKLLQDDEPRVYSDAEPTPDITGNPAADGRTL